MWVALPETTVKIEAKKVRGSKTISVGFRREKYKYKQDSNDLR